jgi:hypothetical protein
VALLGLIKGFIRALLALSGGTNDSKELLNTVGGMGSTALSNRFHGRTNREAALHLASAWQDINQSSTDQRLSRGNKWTNFK